MGRRKRRAPRQVRRPRRSSFFRCPRCMHNSVTVEIDRKGKVALIACFNCGLKDTVPVYGGDETEDVYARFYDRYAGE